MHTRVEPGTWVVAVSGGVDSVALLDMLAELRRSQPRKYRFIVAHFDHGIRAESAQDRRHVQRLAQQYGLPFVYEIAALGPNSSEASARTARYEFLDNVRSVSRARGVITAHHQDDVLETATHYILRGTGRRGLTALSHGVRSRPLLDVPKSRLEAYAQNRNLTWRQDATNDDLRYTRNYIRHRLLTRLTPGQRAQLATLIEASQLVNREIDHQLLNLLHQQPHTHQIDRTWFVHLPHDVAREVVHAWFRARGVQDINRGMVERAVVAIKAGRHGQRYPVDKAHALAIGKTVAELTQTNPPKPARKSV